MKGFTHPAYPDAVRMETPVPVHALPGFEEGWVTVQDASAQGCITFLAGKRRANSRSVRRPGR
jgi:16S rRNA (cytosine967-C5)-methyltransferase